MAILMSDKHLSILAKLYLAVFEGRLRKTTLHHRSRKAMQQNRQRKEPGLWVGVEVSGKRDFWHGGIFVHGLGCGIHENYLEKVSSGYRDPIFPPTMQFR